MVASTTVLGFIFTCLFINKINKTIFFGKTLCAINSVFLLTFQFCSTFKSWCSIMYTRNVLCTKYGISLCPFFAFHDTNNDFFKYNCFNRSWFGSNRFQVQKTNILSRFLYYLYYIFRTMAIALAMTIGRSAVILGNIMFPILLQIGCLYPFLFVALFLFSMLIRFKYVLTTIVKSSFFRLFHIGMVYTESWKGRKQVKNSSFSQQYYLIEFVRNTMKYYKEGWQIW